MLSLPHSLRSKGWGIERSEIVFILNP